MSTEFPNEPTIRFKHGKFARGSRRTVRLWPGVLIVFVACLAFIWNWYARDVQRQDQVMAAFVITTGTLLLLLVWCLFFSRLEWKHRLLGTGFVVAGVLVLASSVRFTSVTGDLVPLFEWRWSAALREVKPSPSIINTNSPPEQASWQLADYPQFLGPERKATLPGPALARDWSARAPRLLWRRTVGAGWSGFAVADTNAVTLEQHGPEEVVVCYHTTRGEPLWRHAYAARYDSPVGGTGPRTVPLIVGDRVYTVGATGVLNCLDVKTGEMLWNQNVLSENGAPVPAWGFACSPLYHAGKIIVNPGGVNGKSLVAYDAETGERIWSAGEAATSYSSPMIATLGWVEQVLSFNQPAITSHDPDTGAVLWEYPWGKGQPHVALPIVVGEDTVMFSSGYGIGAELLRIQRDDEGKWSAEQVWKSIRMKAKFANMVRHGDFVYGLDDGILACIDLQDGGLRWKEGRYGHGQLLLVNDLLLVTAENGEVILLEANPAAARELGRFRAFDHKQWNPPALAGQLLLVRTDREAACYELPLAAQAQPAAAPLEEAAP